MEQNKKNILLVEDSIDLQDLTKELLMSEGYDVHCANNGLEALDFLRSSMHKVDLILLDLMMPVMDGYQFRKLQLLDLKIATIPVVLLTAAGNAETRSAQLKANGFFNKATNIEDLLAVIKRNVVEKGQ